MTRRRALILLAAIAAAVVAFDALGKIWAVAALTPEEGAAVRIDAGLLDFTLVHNTGAAFGIGANATWLFVVVTIVIVAAAIAWIWAGRCRSLLPVVSFGLLVGGGIGNFIDRVTLGYVVDFIEFSFVDFPVFNVADICITIGVVLLLVWAFFFSARESEEVDAAAAADAAGAGVKHGAADEAPGVAASEAGGADADADKGAAAVADAAGAEDAADAEGAGERRGDS